MGGGRKRWGGGVGRDGGGRKRWEGVGRDGRG